MSQSISFFPMKTAISLAFLLTQWSMGSRAELVPIYLEESPLEEGGSCNAWKVNHVQAFDYEAMCSGAAESSDTGLYTVLEGVSCLAVSGVADSAISVSVDMEGLPVCSDPAAIHVASHAYTGTVSDICQTIDAHQHLPIPNALHLMVQGMECFFSPNSPCMNSDAYERVQRLDRFNACNARLLENTAYVLVEDVVCGAHQNGIDVAAGSCVDGNAYRLWGQDSARVAKARHHGVRYAGVDEDDVSPILYNLGFTGFAIGVEILQTKNNVYVYHVSATGNYRGVTPVESRGIQLLCSQFSDNVRSGIASFESDVQVVDTQVHNNGRVGLESSMSTIATLGFSTHQQEMPTDLDKGTFFMEMRNRGESLRECYEDTPGLIWQRA